MAASSEVLQKPLLKITTGLAVGSAILGAGNLLPAHHQAEPVEYSALFPESAFPVQAEGNISQHAKAAKMAIKLSYLEKTPQPEASFEYSMVSSSSTSGQDTLTAVSAGCGDNPAAQFIYQQESSCSTTAVNSKGCVGLGQDCNGELTSACPSLDYACENQFFTNYAENRYGGWEPAEAFWKANGWW